MCEPKWEKNLKKNRYMYESLCCTLENTTTLLINYTPVKNKKLKTIKN